MRKLAFLLISFISFNSHAVDPTQGPLQQHPALCAYGYNPNCYYNGQRPPKKIIQYVDVYVPSKYGAYASNAKTGIGQGALNRSSLSKAKRDAIKLCEQGGRNAPCKVEFWIRNGCIAGAKGKVGQKWQPFYSGEKRGEAEQVALKMCHNSGLKQCTIFLPEGCSLPDGF